MEHIWCATSRPPRTWPTATPGPRANLASFLVTSGPGATNAVTGLATAYMDSIPIVVISGQVPTAQIGTDAFQETDMMGVSRPVVKHSFLVRDCKEIAETVKKAFHIATTGRPGPVVIDVPKDTTDPTITAPYRYPSAINLRSYKPAIKGNGRQIRKATAALLNARRPVIYTGGGVIQGDAGDVLMRLVQRLGFPVTQTLMGLGGVPGKDERFIGMLGMHGTYEANMAMHHADLILAVGARFDDRVTNNPATFCPEATIVHVDVDPASISKIVPADIPIVGHVRSVLQDLLKTLESEIAKAPHLPDAAALDEWWMRIRKWRGGLRPQSRAAPGWRRHHPAAAGHPKPLPGNRGRCLRDQRCRPASDVRRPVLPVSRKVAAG